MKGERLGWFQVASHLGVPVNELQDRITYSEFMDWITFLNREEGQVKKQDFYLAQIAAEVRRGNVKNPRSVKTKDFILKHSAGKDPAPVSKSKSTWASVLKVKLEDDVC